MRILRTPAFFCLGLVVVSSPALQARAAANAATAVPVVESPTGPKGEQFFEKHCVECHDADTRKGKFQIDKLLALPVSESVTKWSRVLTRIEAGEMPPPKKERPEPEAAREFLNGIKGALAAEAKARRADGRARVRRLNGLEYENTVQDLLGIQTPLRSLLPDDDTADGFDNNGRALSISPVHIQRYMEAAERALQEAIHREPQPESKKYRFTFDDEKEQKSGSLTHGNNKPMIHVRGGNLLFFSEPHIEVPIQSSQVAETTRATPGLYKIRVSAFTHDAQGRSLAFALRTTQTKKLLGYFDAPASGSAVVEAEHWFTRGDTFLIAPYLLDRSRERRKLSRYPAKDGTPPNGLALGVEWFEIEGPIHEAWPPKGHRFLFGDLPLKPFAQLPKGTLPGPYEVLRTANRLTPAPEDPRAAARPLLLNFLSKAFRRPVKESDAAPFFEVFSAGLERNECFEAALLQTYQTALCSPEFLFLAEEPGRLNQHALASRLSYMLTRTAPDDTMRALADAGKFAGAVPAEATRLLNSPRSEAFITDFLDQWLHLRDLDATMPDRELFPEFYEILSSAKIDGLLRDSIAKETRLFFGEVLRKNGSLLQLIDADWTFLNNRLAEFYGLPPVDGVQMRRVQLPVESVRGGLLTQASVLKVTANGARTSPVLRGAWVLDNIIGRPPPPPPPDVGTIEPDTRGASTIREQLAKHQNNESCAGCHQHIDPPGFALEAFDPIGQWRTAYRTTGIGTPVKLPSPDGGQLKFLLGAEVDSSGRLPDGSAFAGPWGFKKLTLRQADAITRCLAAKLVTFATGQSPEPGDILALDKIVEATRRNNYTLRALLNSVLQSEFFTLK